MMAKTFASQAHFKIRDAQAVADQYDCQAVVVLCVDRDGTVRVISYGEDKKKCDAIGAWAKGLWRTAISKAPFCTVFGWGNGGEPQPLTSAERAEILRKISGLEASATLGASSTA